MTQNDPATDTHANPRENLYVLCIGDELPQWLGSKIFYQVEPQPNAHGWASNNKPIFQSYIFHTIQT
jgi:hypothetical protein